MKKQKSKEDKKISDSTWVFIIAFLICVVMFFIGVFILNQMKPKVITENSNGFVFVKKGNFWVTDVKNPVINQVYSLEFRYPPSQVKNITIEGNPSSFFKLLELNNLTATYLTFNPNDNLTFMNLAAADISKLLNFLHGVTTVASCTVNETSACQDRPIVTCKSEEGNAMVIYLRSSNEPKVIMNKNCLTIEGSGTDMLRAHTRLLFSWYGII